MLPHLFFTASRYHFEGERNERLTFETVLSKDWGAKPQIVVYVCEACPVGVVSGEQACVQEKVEFDLVCKSVYIQHNLYFRMLVLARLCSEASTTVKLH